MTEHEQDPIPVPTLEGMLWSSRDKPEVAICCLAAAIYRIALALELLAKGDKK